MTRIWFALVSLALFLSVSVAAGSNDSPQTRKFSGSTVLVKFVAGTGGIDSLGKLGCLVTDSSLDNLIFIRYKKQGPLRRIWGSTIHLVSPSWEKDGQCSGTPGLRIPFKKMKTLARGQVQNMGQLGGGTFQWLTTVAASGGVAAALTSSASKTAKIWIGSVAGVIALTGAVGYRTQKTQNYLTILYNDSSPTGTVLAIQSKQVTREYSNPSDSAKTKSQDPKPPGSPPPEGEGLPLSKKTVQITKAASLFCNCRDFAVFQIIDPHDYWNTSMFLNAMTGLTFVQESAAQGTSSSGSSGSGSGAGASSR